jgi:hypothetical protein
MVKVAWFAAAAVLLVCTLTAGLMMHRAAETER